MGDPLRLIEDIVEAGGGPVEDVTAVQGPEAGGHQAEAGPGQAARVQEVHLGLLSENERLLDPEASQDLDLDHKFW